MVSFTITWLSQEDTVVLWSKSSTLDRKVDWLNPATANFSFEVDDIDAQRKKEEGNKNRRARERPYKCVNDVAGYHCRGMKMCNE